VIDGLCITKLYCLIFLIVNSVFVFMAAICLVLNIYIIYKGGKDNYFVADSHYKKLRVAYSILCVAFVVEAVADIVLWGLKQTRVTPFDVLSEVSILTSTSLQVLISSYLPKGQMVGQRIKIDDLSLASQRNYHSIGFEN